MNFIGNLLISSYGLIVSSLLYYSNQKYELEEIPKEIFFLLINK